MNNTDLSLAFDTFYNNITSNAAPGLDDVDKSYIFTKAEYEVVLNHLNPAGNKYRQGIDDSSRRQIDFSGLIVTDDNLPESDNYQAIVPGGMSLGNYVYYFGLPNNMLMVLNEQINISIPINPEDPATKYNVYSRVGVHLSYDQYTKLLQRPFSYPLKRQVWVVVSNTGDALVSPVEKRSIATVILNPEDTKLADLGEVHFALRYVRKPNPIVFAGAVGEAFDSVAEQECELDSALHMEIVQRAVEIAKAAYDSGVTGTQQFQNMLTIGQRSE